MRPLSLGLTVLATLATLALAGCQAETEPGLQPADPTSTGTPEPTSTGTSDPTEESPAPAGDPLTFGSAVARVTIECFPRGERRMVVFDSVTTDRAVSLTGLEAGGDALRVEGAWVRPLDESEVTEGGLIDLKAGRSVPGRWPGAEPLEGAALEPDARYSFYVLGRVVPDARFDDLTLGWADDATSDASAYSFDGRTRSGGC